jgi:2-amino-1-hydroxyethylphosphonate dioxygenase (glycine-forming)
MLMRDRLLAIYREAGAYAYFGESLTTLEHSLQTALFAQVANASNSLVLAALLRDLGHLIEPASADLSAWAEDARSRYFSRQ